MSANPHLLLALTALFWAAHWIVARALVPHASPVAMAFWRWAIAIALIAPFALPAARVSAGVIRANWRPILFFGTCGTVGYNAVGYVGIAQSTATNAVLLQSVTPGLIPLLAWLLFAERIRARQAAGLAVSFCGVLAIVSRLDAAVLASLAVAPGDLWLLGNVLLWSLYTACLRWRPAQLPPLAFMLAVMLAGMLSGLPLALLDFAAGGGVRLSLGAALGLLYLAAFPSVLCYLMWNRAVAAVGPATAGAYLHLVPLAGAAMAIVFLGERLEAHHLVGAALILAGVALVTRASR